MRISDSIFANTQLKWTLNVLQHHVYEGTDHQSDFIKKIDYVRFKLFSISWSCLEKKHKKIVLFFFFSFAWRLFGIEHHIFWHFDLIRSSCLIFFLFSLLFLDLFIHCWKNRLSEHYNRNPICVLNTHFIVTSTYIKYSHTYTHIFSLQ